MTSPTVEQAATSITKQLMDSERAARTKSSDYRKALRDIKTYCDLHYGLFPTHATDITDIIGTLHEDEDASADWMAEKIVELKEREGKDEQFTLAATNAAYEDGAAWCRATRKVGAANAQWNEACLKCESELRGLVVAPPVEEPAP